MRYNVENVIISKPRVDNNMEATLTKSKVLYGDVVVFV